MQPHTYYVEANDQTGKIAFALSNYLDRAAFRQVPFDEDSPS